MRIPRPAIGASGFGGDQRGQRNGCAEADGSQDEREGGWGDDPNEDILYRLAPSTRAALISVSSTLMTP